MSRLTAQLAEGVEIVAEAAGILDEAEGEQACAVVDGAANVVDPQPAIAALDATQLDAARGEVQPGIDVGGIFLGGDDDVVAGLPRQALGDDADAFAGVLDEGHVERIGVEQPTGQAAHFVDALEPAALVDEAVGGEVVGPLVQGVLARSLSGATAA